MSRKKKRPHNNRDQNPGPFALHQTSWARRNLAKLLIGVGITGGIAGVYVANRQPSKDTSPAVEVTDEPYDNTQLLEEIARLYKDSQGIFIGENHTEDSARLLMYTPGTSNKSAIDQLRASGCQALILEMLHAEDQKLLDDYCDGKTDSSAIRDKLRKEWAWTEKSVDQYMQLIESAKNHGIRIYGGYPTIRHEEYNDEDPKVLVDIIDRIDNSIAAVAKQLAAKNIKYAVYCGSGHLSDTLEMRAAVADGDVARANRGVPALLAIPSIEIRLPMKGLTHTIATDMPGGATVEFYTPYFRQSSPVIPRMEEASRSMRIRCSPHYYLGVTAESTRHIIRKLDEPDKKALSIADQELTYIVDRLLPIVSADRPALNRTEEYSEALFVEMQNHFIAAKQAIEAVSLNPTMKKELLDMVNDCVRVASSLADNPPVRRTR